MKNRVLLILSLIFVTSNIVSAQTAKKVITNDDLEKYRVKRETAESEYRRTYKERGMPSPEELEQREKESQKQLAGLSQKLAYERQQNGYNFQVRASDLRNQIISVDAQINYLNGLVANSPNQNQIVVTTDQLNSVVIGGYGYRGGGGRGGYRPPVNTVNPANNVQAARNAAASAPNPYYGTPLYPAGVKAVIGANNAGRGGYRGGHYGGYYGGYGYPVIANNNSYGRDELLSRLQYLEQVRAGLLAQWNQLADEAHRAGVRID